METTLSSMHKISDDIKIFDFDKVTKMLQKAFWSEGIGIDEVRLRRHS